MTKLIIYSFLILFCIFNKAVAEPYAQLMAYYPNGENIMDRHPQMILDDDFNVHISYKAQLKSFKKRYFDPFRRRKKFYYYYNTQNNEKKSILTTIGQMNFFKWAFDHKVIEYVEERHHIISKAMNKANKEDKKRKKNKTTKSFSSSKSSKSKYSHSTDKKEDDELSIFLSFD